MKKINTFKMEKIKGGYTPFECFMAPISLVIVPLYFAGPVIKWCWNH